MSIALSSTALLAQEQSDIPLYHIVDIFVTGNEKTKEEVILRELRTEIGDTVSARQLEYDNKRIESLGLFTRVQMAFERRENGVALRVHVTEQWYIFPWPLIYFNDREYTWKKLSYGANLVHLNFRGMAEQLILAGWAGYNPGASFEYVVPAVAGNKNYFLRTRFFYYRIRNKTFEIQDIEVDEQQLGGFLTLGKRLNLENSISMSLGYFKLEFDPGTLNQTLNPSGTDHVPSVTFNFKSDYRDLIWYPSQGHLFSLSYKKSGIWNDEYIDYRRLSLDGRFYHNLFSKVIFATRTAFNISEGHIPIYDRLYLGYTYRVRGHVKNRYEGENRLITSAEIRFPIIPVRYISVEDGSFGNYGRNLKFGVGGAFFLDYGSLWLNSDNARRLQNGASPIASGPFGLQTRPDEWIRGLGFGLHFHLPYVQLARLEWGFGEDGKSELLFDAEVAF